VNKAQLVEAIQDQLGGRQQAADAVDVVLDAIVRSVVAGERVSVTGFGSFEKVDRPARYARNPQTGERVRVRKTSVPRFRAGAGFKELVSGAKKLPKNDVAVKKAPKGSLMGGTSAKKAVAKKTTAKKASAKRTAAKKTAAVKKATAKRMPAKKTAAKKSTAKSTAAKKSTAKKAAGKKTAAKKTTAKKSTAKKATAKKAPARKAPGRRTAARKTTAKRATARKR
jgi:DNA-binding protein HU-beta